MVADTNKDADTITISAPKQNEHTVPSSGPQCCSPPEKSDVLTPLPLVREFHRQLPTLSCSLGVQARGSSTALTLRNGWSTVVNGKLIHFAFCSGWN